MMKRANFFNKKKKRANFPRKKNADRISSLPDSILSRILSYIPTKNAVATSALSKRWKSLWKAVHNLDFKLDFCDDFCLYRRHNNCTEGWSVDEDMEFASFVNHVMLHHDSGFLNMFRLVWKPRCIPSQVNSWISTAITRNVHELFLCLENSDAPFEIPSSVFSCATLKSLELDGNMFVSDSVAFCLPRLENLKLVSVYFQSDEAFQKLISGCQVLNFLSIEMHMDTMLEYIQPFREMGTNFFHFIISSTSLKCFMLDVGSEHIVYEDLPYCSVDLEAPSLDYIRVEGFVPQIIVRESLSFLVEADFNLTISDEELSDDNICNSLVEAIIACECAKTITLSKYAFSALNNATIGLSTKFKSLTELTTEADCCCCSSLQDFLQSSDSLEVLTVNKEPPVFDSYNHTHSYWTNLEEIPRCLSTSLKTVQIFEYGGLDCDLELIGYLLMHGSALEDMLIYCDLARDHNKFELLQEICAFPRKSPACKVKFISRKMELRSFALMAKNLENIPFQR